MNPEVPTNVLDYCAPSTRGILADITKGGDPVTMARFAATLLDQINPAMVVIANKYGNTAPIVLTQTLRSMVSEVVSDTWAGPKTNGKTAPVDAFDRKMEFTLYVQSAAVVQAMDWCTANDIPKFNVEDDRGGTGNWKVVFESNGSKIIESMSRMCREEGIDVQIRFLEG